MLSESQSLLMPISAENPAGNNLEYEPLFDEIRQARESDPDYLPQDEWAVSEPRKANWGRVKMLSEKALSEKSKDLQLACWFVEALCHQQGLAGLNVGLQFLSEFISRFWFLCWPSLEDEGITVRRSQLLRLDKEISLQLSNQAVLSQENTSLAHWRQILAFEHKLNTQPDLREALFEQEGDLSMASFELRIAQFSSIEISQQAERVEQLNSEIAKLESRFNSLCPEPEENLFTQTVQALGDLDDYLKRLAQRAIPLNDGAFDLAPVVESPLLPAENRATRGAPQEMDREQSITQMLAIAAYFRRTEPSSPVPFLMERAARWASMTLTEWLEEMLNDSNSIHDINNVLTGKTR